MPDLSTKQSFWPSTEHGDRHRVESEYTKSHCKRRLVRHARNNEVDDAVTEASAVSGKQMEDGEDECVTTEASMKVNPPDGSKPASTFATRVDQAVDDGRCNQHHRDDARSSGQVPKGVAHGSSSSSGGKRHPNGR